MRRPVDRYVDRLLRRRRPKPFAPTQDDVAILRTAIDLKAAADDGTQPRPDFVAELRARLADRERGGADAGEAPRPAWQAPARRRVLAAGALTATGVAAGALGDRLLSGPASAADSPDKPVAELTPIHGSWQAVTAGAELPEGAVLPFDLGAVNGFLRRVSGRVQAVSGICTHQGCRLDLNATRDLLTCPCHGASFNTAGANLTHPRPMSHPLPALPRLPVREQDGQIEVFAPAPD
jgi:nitrite reductase/ring-hydroxylating ferredoxin subunit